MKASGASDGSKTNVLLTLTHVIDCVGPGAVHIDRSAMRLLAKACTPASSSATVVQLRQVRQYRSIHKRMHCVMTLCI